MSLDDTKRAVERYVSRYNTVRLHNAMTVVTPDDKMTGNNPCDRSSRQLPAANLQVPVIPDASASAMPRAFASGPVAWEKKPGVRLAILIGNADRRRGARCARPRTCVPVKTAAYAASQRRIGLRAAVVSSKRRRGVSIGACWNASAASAPPSVARWQIARSVSMN